ncbi:MAG TPA: hypothetical protein VM694_41515 [Polyangium sp.]|nr:hypothetical protein [Polyangium sp.]
MSKRKELSYKWVIIGGGVIISLYFVMRLLLLGGVETSIVASFGPEKGGLVLAGIVAFVSYFVGGILIGIFSPGETVKEPALATFMAILPNAMHTILWHLQYSYPLGGALVGLATTFVIGILMAVAGAWIGEKVQGRTVEKLREDGELPPPKPSNDSN